MPFRAFNAVIVCVALAALPAGAAEKNVVFFDPDANHQAIINITALFNDYFKANGLELKLQPVNNQETFDSLVKAGGVEFAIVSSVSLKRAANNQLTPLLVPESRGDVYYRKLLIDKGNGPPSNFDATSIAATVSAGDPKGDRTLQALRGGGLKLTNTLIIPVSKDIDALLALSFGQVQAALVTPSSIEVLKRINPTALAAARTVYETKRILRAPFCRVGAVNKDAADKVVAALQRMASDPVGKNAIAAMGFDRWVPFEGKMLEP